MKKIIYIALALFVSVSLQAQVDRSLQPKPGPAPKVNIGKPQSFKLPNGLVVLVVENHKLPQVTFALGLDNPPSVEGAIKGVDDLTSAMLGNGTSKITKDDYNEQLDFYGASVNFSTGSVIGTTLSKYLPQILPLVAQGALDPLFTQDEFDSEKAKLLDGIKIGEKSAKYIADNVRRTLLYGKSHPKGEVLLEGTINKVTLTDVKDYYKKYFVPANAYLVVAGDVKFEDVKKLVTANFSSWQKASAPKSSYTEPLNLTKKEIDFIDVPNAVQTEISVNGITNLKMTDPDFFAALLANYILGGGSDSYLFKNLRETHGWTYGSYSNLEGNKYTSDFRAYAAVRNAVVDSALVEILSEVKRVGTEKTTQANLDLAKAKYIGNFVMTAQKPHTIANFALREKTQSLPADFYENYIKNITAVSLDQVEAAAKKYFTAENARIVIVGKASEVLPSLEKLNIEIKYFDKYANPVAKPEAKVVSADVNAKSVLTKYINAVGGEVALKSVKTLMITSTASLQGQELTVVKKETNDGKSFQSMGMMGMVMAKNVFDGKKGYVEMQGQKKEMSEEEIALAKKSAPFAELNLLSSETVKLVGIEKMNDRDAYKLVDGLSSFYYDTETGLKIAESITESNAAGQQQVQMVSYGDYRDLRGVKVPYMSTMNVGMDLELKVTDVKINEGVSDSDFQ